MLKSGTCKEDTMRNLVTAVATKISMREVSHRNNNSWTVVLPFGSPHAILRNKPLRKAVAMAWSSPPKRFLDSSMIYLQYRTPGVSCYRHGGG